MCKYGVLGQGLSLWQMMPFEEPWCTKLYYNVGSYSDGFSTAGKAKRTPVAKLKLLRQFISISKFKGMIENMALIRSRCRNSAFGEEIRDCGRIVEMFYMSRGNIQGKREKTAAPSGFVDILDQEMQRQMDLIKEIVRVSRLHDRENALLLLQKKYSDVDWERYGLEQVPPIEIRRLCLRHEGTMTAKSWPVKDHHCACAWTMRVEDQLEADEKANVCEPIKHGVHMLSVLDGTCGTAELGLKRAGHALSGASAGTAAKLRAAKLGWPSPLVDGAVGSTVGGKNDAIRNTGKRNITLLGFRVNGEACGLKL